MPRQSKAPKKKNPVQVSAKKKTTPKKAVAKKSAPKKAAKKKTAQKKTVTKKSAPKKAVKKKTAPKKTVTKKSAPKKVVKKKTAPKKAVTKKSAPKKLANKKTAQKKTAKKSSIKSSRTRSKKLTAVSKTDFKSFIPYSPKRGEEYMGFQQQQHFKEILSEWKGQLMQEVDRTVSHMKDDAANFPDPADRATQEEEFSLELRTRDRERKLIKKIDETMEKIEQDDYGFCEACGIEIGIKRLEARPTATLCIDCKTLDEIKERQELG